MAVVMGGEIGVPLDCKFELAADDYKSVPIGQVLVSDSFTHNGDVWQLELEKISHRDSATEADFTWPETTRIRSQLKLVTSNPDDNKAKLVRISMLRSDSNAQDSRLAILRQSGDTKAVEICMLNLREDEKVTVLVEVLKCNIVRFEPPMSQMAMKVLKWFEAEDFGDVTLVSADGMKFRCHRDILSRRSPVFAGMFSSGMKENLVNIDGYKGEIVAAMLQFVYVDECGGIGPIADRLYVAADQYQLEQLKILCETSMAANLSAKTVLKTYRLANFYHLDDLMARCVDYLNSHRSELPMEDLLAAVLEIQ